MLRTPVAIAVACVLGLLPALCDPASSGLARVLRAPGSPYEAYAQDLAAARLQRDSTMRDWVMAGERALLEPMPIAIARPFETTGTFGPNAASAVALSFPARAGRHIRITTTFAVPDLELFVDVFRVAEGRLDRVAAGVPPTPGRDAPRLPIELDVTDDAAYVVRVQPERAAAGDYRVAIASSPLLAFPVEGHTTRAIQSGFGVERDGGRRSHRGVDIFAARGTPAVAAVDGWVVRVETTRVGGNVVWLQPMLGNVRLYYAHLDTQTVERGQFVVAGEQVGTVGNTGNAITTPTHLHFGVYVREPGARGGARDPVGFLR